MTKTLQKITAVAVALVLCLGMTAVTGTVVSAAGEDPSLLDWAQFLGNGKLKGVSDAKTPRSADEMELRWTSEKNESDWGMTSMAAPLVIGDYVYYYYRPSLNDYNLKLVKASAEDGTIVGESAVIANGAEHWASFLGSGGGSVFLATCDANSVNAQLHAFDQDTLELQWSSAPMAGSQVESPILYYDGYVYTATYGTGGGMYCYNTETAAGSAVQPAWKLEIADSYHSGFLWAGVEFVSDACVFGHSNGTLYSVDRRTGAAIDTMTIPAQFLDTGASAQNISATPYYYEKNGRLYVSVSGVCGGVLGIQMNRDGSFDESNVLTFQGESGLGIKSSVVIYNDRVYVTGSGGSWPDYVGAPFRVLNANTLEEIYRISDISTKGSLVMTTAYAAKENNQQVYLYVLPYEPGGTTEDSVTYSEQPLYIIRDSAGQTAPDYERVDLADLGVLGQYCATTMVIGSNGNLYINNDAGYLWCVGNKNGGTITGQDVFNQIARLPEVGEYQYYNDFELRRILERYHALDAAEQETVTNIDKLTAMLAVSNLTAERLVEAIDSLPDAADLTLEEHGSLVETLYQAYRQMPQEDQNLVVNAGKLEDAYAQVIHLRRLAAVDDLIGEIAALPDPASLTLAQGTAVSGLAARLAALPEEYAAMVTNAGRLTAAQVRLAAISGQLQALDTLIKDTLTGPVTLDSKAAIDAALAGAEGLAAEDLQTINSYGQYFVPALIDYVNLLIAQMYDANGSPIVVTAENKGEVAARLAQIDYYLGFVPEEELRYVRGMEDLAEWREQAEAPGTPTVSDTAVSGAPATGDTAAPLLLPVLALGVVSAITIKRKRAK